MEGQEIAARWHDLLNMNMGGPSREGHGEVVSITWVWNKLGMKYNIGDRIGIDLEWIGNGGTGIEMNGNDGIGIEIGNGME